jgi:hypothetical protein
LRAHIDRLAANGLLACGRRNTGAVGGSWKNGAVDHPNMTLPSHLPAAAAFASGFATTSAGNALNACSIYCKPIGCSPRTPTGTSREARFLLGGRAFSFDPSSSLDAQTVARLRWQSRYSLRNSAWRKLPSCCAGTPEGEANNRNKVSIASRMGSTEEKWSERGDLNSRPPVPQSGNYRLSSNFPSPLSPSLPLKFMGK